MRILKHTFEGRSSSKGRICWRKSGKSILHIVKKTDNYQSIPDENTDGYSKDLHFFVRCLLSSNYGIQQR